ncbi:MAG: SdiA-regulated domain-containing protein [Bacteroidota bacterium]
MLRLKFFLHFFFLVIILFTSCSDDTKNDIVPEDSLELLATHNISVLEPSGLAIDKTGTVLYSVSDNTGNIYKLSTEGVLLKTYHYGGDDLEGVTNFTGSKLLLAEERTRQIVEYDISTGNISRHYINYENNSANSGIEGVAYKENDGSTFILNEKDPGKLIRLRADFSIIAEYELNFASDYSGIFYDISTNNLWILSDQNKTLNRCTLMGVLIEKHTVNVTQAEGIAITNDKIFIVSDAESKLYVYKKPQY